MKIHIYIVRIISLYIFFLNCCSLNIHAQDNIDIKTDKSPQEQSFEDVARKKSKKQLIKENYNYYLLIDSLRRELELYQNEASSSEEEAINEDKENDESDLSSNKSSNTFPGAEKDIYAETDSLLNIWYQNQKSPEQDEVLAMEDSIFFTSNVPDSIYIERLNRLNSFITLPFNKTVKNYIILYSERLSSKMEYILGLSNFYLPYFEEIFNKHGIPEELKYMAIIESSLNPTAISRAGAKGMWQFMYATAKRYNLKINSFVDERFDPIKSAEAAALYLKDAYNIFGDWTLAISSYNCGAGNVNKAIRRNGGKRDFWSIYPYLPKETRGYMPAFVGAMYAMKYYKEHRLKPIELNIPAHVDTFEIRKMLHFTQINELVGISKENLKKLNPQYLHGIIPGSEQEAYILRIPFNYTNDFIACEDSLYSHKSDELFNPINIRKLQEYSEGGTRLLYRVKSGDCLGSIARKYRVSIKQLKRWNGLRGNFIRAGQRLSIYHSKPYTAPPFKASDSSKVNPPQKKEAGDSNLKVEPVE